MQTVAGRAAKQKQEKRVAKSNGQGSTESIEAAEKQDRYEDFHFIIISIRTDRQQI